MIMGKTAIVTNEESKHHNKQGVVVAEEGDESNLGGVIPKDMIEIHLGSPFLPRDEQYIIVSRKDVEIHEV